MSNMALSTLRVGPVGFGPGVYGGTLSLVLTGIGFLIAGQPLIGWLATGLGVAFFLWGTTIHGQHLWQSWWAGPPFPFKVKAWSSRNWNFKDGQNVGGIRWNTAYAQIRVNLTNVSERPIEDVAARLIPDQPIIESRARCEWADCRIGLEGEPVDITVRARMKDGSEADIPSSEIQLVRFGPPHRLFCQRPRRLGGDPRRETPVDDRRRCR